MLDALIHIFIFLIDAIILVAAILIIFAGFLALLSKGKDKPQNKVTVTDLNKQFSEMSDALKHAKRSKQEIKAAKKLEKKNKKKSKKTAFDKHVYVVDFNGDIKASAVESLRQEVSAILSVATPEDEVVLRLESPGGVVHGYGLAASQLQRIRDHQIPLTIVIDKVAASGGYMMACVASKILSAPFAIIGSIGVVAQLPNFHQFLKKHQIDFEQITAGEYKRTLTMFGKNTEHGREKMQHDITEAHQLFKDFVKTHRPVVNIEEVGTGEYWFGQRAHALKLVDELKTSDDYLLDQAQSAKLHLVKFHQKKPLSKRFFAAANAALERLYAKDIELI